LFFLQYIISPYIDRVSNQQRHDLELVWRQRWVFGRSCAAERKKQMVARPQQVLAPVPGNTIVMFLYLLHFILLPKDCVRTVAEVVGVSRLLEGTYMAAC
jgi:hypothetical protein